MGLFTRRRRAQAVCRLLADSELAQIRDTRGFDHGVIIDSGHGQMTLISTVTADDGGDYAAMISAMAADADLVSLTRVTEDNGRYLSATFAATEKTERKHREEFLSTRAVKAENFMHTAAAAGIRLEPVDKAGMSALAARVWPAGAGGQQWPPVADDVEETVSTITCLPSDMPVNIVFEVDVDAVEALDEFLDELAVETGVLRSSVVVRPPLAEAAEPESTGRRCALVTVRGANVEDAEDTAAELVSGLSPLVRLRVHRMLGRQQAGLLAGAGLGVLGWQQINLTGKPVAA